MKIPKQSKKVRLAAGAAIIIAVIAIAAWAGQHKKDNTPSPTQTNQQQGKGEQTPSTSTPNPGSGAGTGSSSPGSGSNPPAPTATPDHPQGSTLAKPTGQVLSHHTVSLSSSDPKNSPALNSTCKTVFGAQCGVRLSMNGTIKTVPLKSVDDRGEAIIDWNAKDLGLTPGSWTVQLLAQSNGQTSLGDADTLVVNQ